MVRIFAAWTFLFSWGIHAIPNAVEITAGACQTKQGFDASDTGKTGAGLKGYRQVEAFPVLFNAIYRPSRDGNLLDYSLACAFSGLKDNTSDHYLYLPGIGENFDIYLNGVRIHADIHRQGNRLSLYRYTKFLNVSLPSRLLRPGENTIFFHAVGYAPVSPFSANFLFGLPFRDGYSIAPEKQGNQGSLLLFFLTASYIFFGLYHFFFYLRWREKKYNLHFAVFSLAISAYFLAFSQEAFANFANTRYLVVVSYASQMLALAFFLLYVQAFFFERVKIPLYMKFAVACDAVLALCVILGPDAWHQTFLTIWYLFAAPQILIIFYLIFSAVRQRLPDARLLAGSIAIALVMIAFDMLDTLVFYSSIRLSPFAYFTVVVCLVLIMANRFINIQQETDRLNRQLSFERNSFSRFVPSQFLENLGRSTAVEIRRGDTAQRHMGILFMDIRNFTGIAENLTPAESLVFLNVFMRKMEQCISQNGGFVDKYIGDGLLALFGSREGNEAEGAVQAVRAGRQMLQSLSFLNRYSTDFGHVKIGIGVHSGSLVMGTLGSRRRLDTTVIGDAVNLASRLEMLTTLYGVPMLLSGDVETCLPADMQSDTRHIDTVRVKGRKQPVKVVEDFSAESPDIAHRKKAGRHAYSEALAAYAASEFDQAIRLFEAINAGAAYDSVALTLAKRTAKLRKTGAPPGWEGILPLGKK